MKLGGRSFIFISTLVLTLIAIFVYLEFRAIRITREVDKYAGTESCRPCHEKFYQLWAPSHHGLAMQAVTSKFIENELILPLAGIAVGNSVFTVATSNGTLVFTEETVLESKSYNGIHAMGGKYVFYFLTEMEQGRLQVLPLAYNCKTKSWYNNPESGVRHFESDDDNELDWTSHLYTFNTSCYNCHVSQLETNFDTLSLSYNTSWREPGINCETCHGPSKEHIRACVTAGVGNIPEDLKIIVTGAFSNEQHNSLCGSCHSKGSPIDEPYIPGAPFYDYFDIVTLEDIDFYPDGRDLGENYTMVGWIMNRCAQESELHCVSCHTSSGRYKFATENRNGSCMPCHSEKVENPESHTSHSVDSEGSICISCHMPKTTFALMDRSDHSFRPPMPAASKMFASPNACNICHTEKSADWADDMVSRTHHKDYQSKTIKSAELIVSARQGDWQSANYISKGLLEGEFDVIYTTSFLRLLDNIDNPVKWPAVIRMTYHESPLVRSAAAHSLSNYKTRESFNRLVALANDKVRLVRIKAAWSLSSFPNEFVSPSNEKFVRDAIDEYINSQNIRPDNWSSHYNLGNFYRNIGDYKSAISKYERAVKIYPEAIMPLINGAYLQALAGNYKKSERLFQDALVLDPDNEGALLNLALLYGDLGESEKAKACYAKLLESSNKNSVAAYNLSILISQTNLDEAIRLSGLAAFWNPENSRYSYTYSLFLYRKGESDRALELLKTLCESDPGFPDSFLLLSRIYIEAGDTIMAKATLNSVIESKLLSMEIKRSALDMLGLL